MSTAEERTWETVRRAYEERPRGRRRDHRRLVALAALVALGSVVTAAVLSAPGRAVFERVREAVGVEHAAPALFSLPAPGRLLVVSPGQGGVWIVEPDGLKRRIGFYRDARWSPHGLYIVATRPDELAALSPGGGVRWSLARRGVRFPAWEGTRTDTRIAYVTDGGLRVVAGDGTGDRLLDRSGGSTPPAWDPARIHTLAYYAKGAIVLRADDGSLVWRRPITVTPTSLDWSSDGRYLAVSSRTRIIVLDASGHVHRTISELGAKRLSGAFEPGSHRLAVDIRRASRSEVQLVDLDRTASVRLLFAGPGAFGDLAWSPSGRVLLVTWPAANQWIFLHGTRASAVGNIREQFRRAGASRRRRCKWPAAGAAPGRFRRWSASANAFRTRRSSSGRTSP